MRCLGATLGDLHTWAGESSNAPVPQDVRLRDLRPHYGSLFQRLLDGYDWGNGGWGDAPKFPQPMALEFLLRRALSNSPQREQAWKASVHLLHAMARGGMYDVVGGGFARYSVDNFWRVPHFDGRRVRLVGLLLSRLRTPVEGADAAFDEAA